MMEKKKKVETSTKLAASDIQTIQIVAENMPRKLKIKWLSLQPGETIYSRINQNTEDVIAENSKQYKFHFFLKRGLSKHSLKDQVLHLKRIKMKLPTDRLEKLNVQRNRRKHIIQITDSLKPVT